MKKVITDLLFAIDFVCFYLIEHANQVVFIAAQQFSKRLPERFLRRRSHDLIVSQSFWILYQRTFLIDPNDENGRRNPCVSDIQRCRFVRHSVLHLLLWQTFKLPGCGAVRHSSRFRQLVRHLLFLICRHVGHSIAPASICLPKQQVSYISQSSLQGAAAVLRTDGRFKTASPIVDAAAASPWFDRKHAPNCPLRPF